MTTDVNLKYKTIALDSISGGWDLMVKYDQVRNIPDASVNNQAKIVNEMTILAEENAPEGYRLFNLSCLPVSVFATYIKE